MAPDEATMTTDARSQSPGARLRQTLEEIAYRIERWRGAPENGYAEEGYIDLLCDIERELRAQLAALTLAAGVPYAGGCLVGEACPGCPECQPAAAGRLTVDLRYGSTHHHIEGPMGLHPAGVAEILAAVQAALDREVAAPAVALSSPAEQALEWLVYLHHGVGKRGGRPESGEWEEALEAAEIALAVTQMIPIATPPPVETGAQTDEKEASTTQAQRAEPSDEAASLVHQVPEVDSTGRVVARECFRRCLATTDRQACAKDSGLMITTCLCECHDSPALAPPWPFSANDFTHVAIKVNEHVAELRHESMGDDTWFGWSTTDAAEVAKMLLSAAALRREVERLTGDLQEMREHAALVTKALSNRNTQLDIAEREVARLTAEREAEKAAVEARDATRA